jgi:hypothetical protein
LRVCVCCVCVCVCCMCVFVCVCACVVCNEMRMKAKTSSHAARRPHLSAPPWRQHADVCCDAARRSHVSERALYALCCMMYAPLCCMLYAVCCMLYAPLCCMLSTAVTPRTYAHLHVCFLRSLLYHAFSYYRMRPHATRI